MIPVYKSYAQALHRAAEGLGREDTVAGELAVMETLLGLCSRYLGNPLISVGKKADALRELLSGVLDPLTLEFILLMTTRRHLKHFHNAAEEFRQLSGNAKTIVCLRVPFAPEQDMLGQLKDRLAKKHLIPAGAEEAQFLIKEDKELIGGFIASCNGYQIDTSLRTILRRLLRPERLVQSDD